jgi:hypothetical protein
MRISREVLYPDEQETARRVLGPNAKKWPDIALILEREGLPRIDPLMGGRYWPAVAQFLNKRHGLVDAVVPAQADGLETWPERCYSSADRRDAQTPRRS